MPSTKVSKYDYTDDSGAERTQYRTTVPKQVVELLDLEDAEFEWEAVSRNTIKLKITRNDE